MINFKTYLSKRNYSVLILFFSMLIPFQIIAQCNSIDQSQLNYNGGMSARNLPGYSEWQNFTAGATGTLCQIEIGFFNPMTGTGIFNIYNGSGTGGLLLNTQQVTISGSGNFFHTFSLSVPVSAGGVYTFQFIPIQGGGLPDPYGVQVENPGTYQGGELNIVDPSGTYPTGFDMVFKTYVTVSTLMEELDDFSPVISIYPNPFSSEAILKTRGEINNSTVILLNMLGEIVREFPVVSDQDIKIERADLKNEVYFIALKKGESIRCFQKLMLVGD